MVRLCRGCPRKHRREPNNDAHHRGPPSPLSRRARRQATKTFTVTQARAQHSRQEPGHWRMRTRGAGSGARLAWFSACLSKENGAAEPAWSEEKGCLRLPQRASQSLPQRASWGRLRGRLPLEEQGMGDREVGAENGFSDFIPENGSVQESGPRGLGTQSGESLRALRLMDEYLRPLRRVAGPLSSLPPFILGCLGAPASQHGSRREAGTMTKGRTRWRRGLTPGTGIPRGHVRWREGLRGRLRRLQD